MFLIFLSFSSLQCPRQKVLQTEKGRAIFYTHQTIGSCAGVYVWNSTHQIEIITPALNETIDHLTLSERYILTIFANSLFFSISFIM